MALKGPKRQLPAFSLSFLDIMFCGFGAVVLLVLMVNSNMVRHREETGRDLSQEVKRLEMEVQSGRQLLAELRNSLEETSSSVVSAEKESARLVEEITRARNRISQYRNSSLASRQSLEKLQSDLKRLDAERKRLLARERMNQDAGQKARHFQGEGNRQYLTGLHLGGKRILLLVDASASMLDRTILGIIRKRNLPPASRLKARKWQRVIRTARWLLANVPTSSSIRIITFNSRVLLLGESKKAWIPVTSRSQVNTMISRLKKTVPAHGTSLARAFSTAARLSPRPDNIILLTDGLPTIGTGKPGTGKVTSDQRARLFRKAVSQLPAGVPVNTILFPLEGDPLAAGLFWKLAVDTRGSFITPSRDWP